MSLWQLGPTNPSLLHMPLRPARWPARRCWGRGQGTIWRAVGPTGGPDPAKTWAVASRWLPHVCPATCAPLRCVPLQARVKETQTQKKIFNIKRFVCIGGGIALIVVLCALLVVKSRHGLVGEPAEHGAR